MKKYILLLAVVLSTSSLFAQDLSKVKLDKSPMDAAFFPSGAAHRAFAKSKEQMVSLEPKIRVLYGRPSLKERNIFRTSDDRKEGITKLGEAWRVGANESTELLLLQDAMIGGKNVKAGRYSIVITPNKNEWTVHINTENDGWGNYSHKPDLDIVTVSIPVTEDSNSLEQLSMTMYSPNKDNTVHLKIGWGTYRAEMPIKLI